jgi:glucans biosynthesis protein
VRSQVSVGDNAEVVENNLRYNPETKGWRLTLRLKVKDANKSTEMRAALVRDVPVEPAKPAQDAKQDKAAAKQPRKAEKAKATASRRRPPRRPRPPPRSADRDLELSVACR